MKKTFLLSAMLSLSLTAIAGDKGNGGGSHYCTNPDGSFKSIETFDLYEGRERYQLDIPKWNGQNTKGELIQIAINRIKERRPGFARQIQNILDKMKLPNFFFDKSGKVLSTVNDANEWYVDEGCKYKQIINWIEGESDIILRDKKYFDRMDPLSQAALEMHEAIFKLTRKYKRSREKIIFQDSTKVRKFVAEIFSLDPIESFTLEEKQTELYFNFGEVKSANGISIFKNESDRYKEIEFNTPIACDKKDYHFSVELDGFSMIQKIKVKRYRMKGEVYTKNEASRLPNDQIFRITDNRIFSYYGGAREVILNFKYKVCDQEGSLKFETAVGKYDWDLLKLAFLIKVTGPEEDL